LTSPWIEPTKVQARRIAAVLVAACSVGCASASADAPQHSGVVAGDDYREPSAAVTSLFTAAPPPEPLLHAGSGHLALLHREAVLRGAPLLGARERAPRGVRDDRLARPYDRPDAKP